MNPSIGCLVALQRSVFINVFLVVSISAPEICLAFTCTHIHTHTHTHKHTHTHTRKHTRKQTHTHTHKQTNKQTNTHTHKQTNKQTNKHTHTHTHTHTQTPQARAHGCTECLANATVISGGGILRKWNPRKNRERKREIKRE